MTLQVLAVADSESFVKWSAATLASLSATRDDVEPSIVVIRGPLEPSPSQLQAATAGTRFETIPTISRRELARRIATRRPEAVLVAATGPVAEMIALTVIQASGEKPPVLLAGPPGVAMSRAATTGVLWRHRWCDAYIVHSPREADRFSAAFARLGAHPEIVLEPLPFLRGAEHVIPARERVQRVVFAPQAVVPHARADRVAILDSLARLKEDDGYDVVVKVRSRPGEQQTHHEALPFEVLWAQEHAGLGHGRDALRFESGPMAQWLTPGSALVTVSSTAALESMSYGLPTALLADFGVDDALGNPVYAGSGCEVRLSDLGEALRQGGPLPTQQWMQDNYFHGVTGELARRLPALVDAARADSSRRPPRPVRPLVYHYSTIKSRLPWMWYPARLARRIIGRLKPLY